MHIILRCSMQGKHNQVLNLNNFSNDHLGWENDFAKSLYSLTLFEDYFRHSLGALHLFFINNQKFKQSPQKSLIC